MISKFITGIAAVLLSLLGCSAKPAEDNSFYSVSAPEFKKALETGEDCLLVDIRTRREYGRGYIKGSLNIDFYADDFRAQLSGLDKSKDCYIYCHSGSRTAEAMAIMKGLGFKKVVALRSGIMDWRSNDYPLEK